MQGPPELLGEGRISKCLCILQGKAVSPGRMSALVGTKSKHLPAWMAEEGTRSPYAQSLDP